MVCLAGKYMTTAYVIETSTFISDHLRSLFSHSIFLQNYCIGLAKDEQGANSLKVEVGKAKSDPVVMGLLKSTMFPLQQVLEGMKVSFCKAR